MTYIQPTSTVAVSGRLSLTQFIQTVLVGISNLPGALVRPNWQIEPPKQPDITTNWLAFGIDVAAPDANASIQSLVVTPATDEDPEVVQTTMQRHEMLDIGCHIYGPDALEIYGLIRDGFQIPQNLEALRFANMGFVEVAPGRQIPDLVNERFVTRIVTNIFLRREIQRVYPIPILVSAEGVIHTVLGSEEYLLDWETQTEET